MRKRTHVLKEGGVESMYRSGHASNRRVARIMLMALPALYLPRVQMPTGASLHFSSGRLLAASQRSRRVDVGLLML